MHPSNRVHLLLWGVLLVLILTAAPVFGQTSELSGVLRDPQGAVVPGADVTLTNQGTQNQRSAITDSEGRFRFLLLPPGTYSVRCEMPGFKTLEQNDLRLLVDTPVNLDLQLDLGQVSEIITVASTTQKLKNEIDGSIGNAFNTQQIEELPLNERNVYQLLSAQPGVTRNGYVAGARSDQQNLTLDGIDVNEQQTGATYGNETADDVAFKSVLRVTPDSVQEFRVTTSSPTASQGRSSGAQVSLVTKSGTNEFHGSLYEYHRNTATAANDFFNNRIGLERPKLIRNLYGGSIGGPLVKEKAFFFFNYEGRKDRKGQTQLNIVPLAHMGDGILRYRNSAHQPAEIGPDEIASLFPDIDGVNPIATAVLGAAAGRYPANDSGNGDLLNTSGFRFNAPAPLDWNTFTTRVDLVPSDNQSIMLRANYQWDHETLSKYWPDTLERTYWSHPFGVMAGHTWNIRPTLINNFRYGLTRQALTDQGDSNANFMTFRFVYDPNGGVDTLSRTTPVHNFTNDTSWVKGDHTLQFGTNIRFVNNDRTSYGTAFDFATMNPSFYASSGDAMDVIDDLEGGLRDVVRNGLTALLGRYTQYNANGTYDLSGNLEQSGTPTFRQFASNEYELYFEDTWQTTDNLTLNLGVRWSVATPVEETSGFEVAPSIPLGDYFNLRKEGMARGVPYNGDLSVDLAGPKYGKPGYYKTDWNNFSPRISFAYSPHVEDGFLHAIFGDPQQSVIRGGFSMMYDRVGSALAVSWDLSSTLGFVLSDSIAANTFNATTDPGPLFTGFDQDIRDLEYMNVADNISFPLSQAA
ncbi:MAG: TonB-dependent receptor, partial [Acidobacteriota bacterium]